MSRNSLRDLRCRSHISRRPGHILLMTLMLLAITVVMVTGIARRSMQLAFSASQSRTELQEKWAVASCQRFVLQNSGRLLGVGNENPDSYQANVTGFIVLSDLKLDFELADESSKLDLNTLSEYLDRESMKDAIAQLTNQQDLTIQLRPTKQANEILRQDRYESWGQVFSCETQPSASVLQQATNQITCWGRKINLRTASPEVIRIAANPVAGAIVTSRLVSELETNRQQSLEELLRKINPSEQQVLALRKILSDRSRALSVWVALSDRGTARSYFLVQEKFSGNLTRIQTFDMR